MKKAIILFSVCSAVLLFSDCHKKMYPTAAKTPAEEVAYAKNNYSDAPRAEGKALFEKSCGGCHDLPVPGQYTVLQWDDILPKMFKKAELNYDNAGLVKAYVIFNSKAL